MTRFLTALPVYNELKNVNRVLDEVVRHADDVLVVDDGSKDGTSELLEHRRDIQLVTHDPNRGYGAALITAFDYAVTHGYELLITIDCDGQHEPQRIREFVAEYDRTGADLISGSRYLEQFGSNTPVPVERRRINHHITQVLNARLG
ncbi:MAG: glycosyltransferase family 2 protein, partial [Planctomycetota bacterium]